VINSLGGEQDNVVFLGRRSFRMEIAGRPDDEEMAIPAAMTPVSTQKLFMPDHALAADIAALRSPPARGISRTTLIAMCSATFAFGIVLTLTFNHRTERPATRAATMAAPASAAASAPATTVPAPASMIIVQPLPSVAPETPRAAALLVPPASRPLAKLAPAVRSRPARPAPAPRAVDPTPAGPATKPWVDPFAE
jgi:hypothetical protein